jgi:hypothetical protein
MGDHHIGCKRHQFRRRCPHAVGIVDGKPQVDLQVAAFDPAEPGEPLAQGG